MLIVDAQVHIWGADTPERPWPAVRHRSSGAGARRQGRSGVRGSAAAVDARQIPECRGQGVGPAARLERAVSLSETAPLSAPGVRRVWPKADVLGYRSDRYPV